MKTCPKCHIRERNGKHAYCTICMKTYLALWRTVHREHIKSYKRAWKAKKNGEARGDQ